MTAEEMKYSAEVQFDVLTNYSAPGISAKEWSLLFTEAQEELLREKLDSILPSRDITIEETEKIAGYFNLVIVSSSVANTGTLTNITVDTVKTLKNNDVVNISMSSFGANIFHILYERFTGTSNTIEYKVIAVPHNYIKNNITNPFKKPYGLEIWRIKTSDEGATPITKHQLIFPSSVRDTLSSTVLPTSTYYVRYYKVPEPIIVYDSSYSGEPATSTIRGVQLNTLAASRNCELNQIIHPDIVTRAINKARAIIGDGQKLQMEQINQQLNQVQ